jgi:F-type H+-transporting ATPase subunit a
MSHSLALASGVPHVLASGGYTPPGPIDFLFTDFRGNTWDSSGYLPWFTKPAALLILAGLLAFVFLRVTSRKQAVVPSKAQYLGEQAYEFVRNGVARDIIGERDFIRFVPLLVSLFFFLIISNLFGIVPILSLAPFSRVSYAYGLAVLVWIIYNGVGIADKGFVGYLKHTTVPAGVPLWIMPVLVPLEFLSNILVRPITLSLRLFANMFAGHLLLILFSTGGAFLLLHATGPAAIDKPAGILSYVLGIAVGFLEVIVAVLQAYVFTLLTALYISGSLASEH